MVCSAAEDDAVEERQLREEGLCRRAVEAVACRELRRRKEHGDSSCAAYLLTIALTERKVLSASVGGYSYDGSVGSLPTAMVYRFE